jgi:hypothetical protein
LLLPVSQAQLEVPESGRSSWLTTSIPNSATIAVLFNFIRYHSYVLTLFAMMVRY